MIKTTHLSDEPKIKLFKAYLHKVTDKKFFLFRIAKLYK